MVDYPRTELFSATNELGRKLSLELDHLTRFTDKVIVVDQVVGFLRLAVLTTHARHTGPELISMWKVSFLPKVPLSWTRRWAHCGNGAGLVFTNLTCKHIVRNMNNSRSKEIACSPKNNTQA